ncbi:hypothetical protein Fot_19507 [Forsythia ovata]|uniref:Uncharacterized protein n=1 Tax=Forsythia ovata TaxID=205694 RepID=A0ABD1VLJ5_9LAMI
MTGFYFSNVPKLKIRRGGVVDDIPLPPPVSCVVSILGISVLQAHEAMTIRKEKGSRCPPGRDGRATTVMPEKDIDDAEDPQRARQGPDDPSSGVKDRALND